MTLCTTLYILASRDSTRTLHAVYLLHLKVLQVSLTFYVNIGHTEVRIVHGQWLMRWPTRRSERAA